MSNISLIKDIKKFIKVDKYNKILFIKAFIFSGLARFLILHFPFKEIKKYMGKHNQESPYEIDKSRYKMAKKVRWAVLKASEYTPWESKCMVRALVAQRLLYQNNIYTTIYLGVNKVDNKLKAHAWLRCGEFIITGEKEKSMFKEVARFSNHK